MRRNLVEVEEFVKEEDKCVNGKLSVN